MADIFDEVEEGLRQDKFSAAWSKYGIFAYLGAGLLIGGVALNEYLTYSQGEQVERRSGQLEAALSELEARDYEAAAASLSALVDADDAVSPIAAHFLAQVRLEGNGDLAAAGETLSSMSAGGDGPAEKLGLIKAAYLKADTATRAELEDMLAPLRSENSAFGALALELVAAKALAEGDIEFARSEFNLIEVLSEVPDGVRQRAAQALASLPPAAVPDVLPLIEVPENTESETEGVAGVETGEGSSDVE